MRKTAPLCVPSGIFSRSSPVQSGNRQICPQRSLRNAQRNRAIKIRAAPLEERVLLDFEHNIQITRRPAVGTRFAFTLHAQPRSGVHARRDAQFDSALAIHASLALAIRATFFDDLPGALASGTRAVDGEKSLLIDLLAASAASLARHHAGSLFRARAVARFAVFLPGHPNFRGDAGGGFVKRQRHVIAQIRATLHATPATAPASAARRQTSPRTRKTRQKCRGNPGRPCH